MASALPSPSAPRKKYVTVCHEFLDGLAAKSALEVKAIGMKSLRDMCLLQESFRSRGELNANAFRVAMVVLPETFGYMSPDVHIVDVAVEKWFDFVQRKMSKPEHSHRSPSITITIDVANLAAHTIKSFGSFVAHCNWLRDNYGYDRDENNRLNRVVKTLISLFEYCRNWGYADGIYNRFGRSAAPETLTSGTVAAFRALYEQCKSLQDNVIKYVLSVDFARELAKKPKATDHRGSVLIDVLEYIRALLLKIDDFDMRGAADLWKCMMKLATDHMAVLLGSQMGPVRRWLSAVNKMLSRNNIHKLVADAVSASATDDNAEFRDRNMKMALFYAKILLRVYTMFGAYLKFELFADFVDVFLDLKKILRGVEEPQAKKLIGLFEEMIPLIYGHGLGHGCRRREMSMLDLFMNIYNLLLNESNQIVFAIYANSAFMLIDVADLLHEMSLANTADISEAVDHYRPVVARIAALAVVTSHRFPALVEMIDLRLLAALKTNQFYAGILVFDVWQVRCAFMSPEQQLHYAHKVWSNNIGFGVFCYRTASVFGRALLCSFYDSLPPHMHASFISGVVVAKDEYRTEPHMQVHPVWGVLGADRIADPIKRESFECAALAAYEAAAAKCSTPKPYVSEREFYEHEQARQALRGVRQPKAMAILDAMCAHLHINVPIYFSSQLHHLLDNASALTASHVMAVLENLSAYFAIRRTEPTDTLIRLQTIDFLRHVSTFEITDEETRPKCVQIVASLLGELMKHTASDGASGEDVVVRTNCMRMFAEVGPQIRYEEIIVQTLRLDVSIKVNLARVLNKERLPAVAVMGKPFLSDVRYKHVCKGRIKMSKQDVQAAIDHLRASIRLVDRIRQYNLFDEKQTVELQKANDEFNWAIGFRNSSHDDDD